jgi:hypothetical protein
MVLYLVKVPGSVAERIVARPELLDQVWEEAEVEDDGVARLDEERDKLMEDYLGLARDINERPERYPWMQQALNGIGAEIPYDFGYSQAFVITPEQAGAIAAGLAEEGWWRPGQEIVTIDHAIAAFYTDAARDGRTVIGGIG